MDGLMGFIVGLGIGLFISLIASIGVADAQKTATWEYVADVCASAGHLIIDKQLYVCEAVK